MRKHRLNRKSPLRLKGCNLHCPCLCHDTGGGVTELHSMGYCDGKTETNSVEALEAYARERANQ